jgi:nucleotide-binding universal stress UspA family protein
MVEDAHKKQKKIKAILIKAGMDAGEKITALTGYGKITIDVKTGRDIELLIEESIKDKHADLVAMFPKKGFFEQLFTGSVTREISYHIVIPLLAIKQT